MKTISDWSFTKGFLAVVAIFVLTGFVIPALISQPSDAGVILAILIFLGLVYCGLLTLKRLLERSNGEKKNEKNNRPNSN